MSYEVTVGKFVRFSSLMTPGFVDCHTDVLTYLLAGLRSKFDTMQTGNSGSSCGNGVNERRIRTMNVVANDKYAASLFTTCVVRAKHNLPLLRIIRG